MMCPALTAVVLLTVVGQLPANTRPESAIDWDDYAPCGVVTLYLVCRTREVPASWQEVKEATGIPGPGGELSFADIAAAAEKLGMRPLALETGRQALNDLPMPAIVQVHDSRFPDELPHFLLLLHPESDGVWLLDAPFPPYFLPEGRFEQSWTGKVMVFAHNEEEANRIHRFSRGFQLLISGGFILAAAGLLTLFYLSVRSVRIRKSITASGFQLCAKQFHRRFGNLPSKRSLSLATLLVLPFIVGACAVILSKVPWLSRSPPQCYFHEQVVELGELQPGAHQTHVSVLNKGDETLHISDIESSCSCAVVKHVKTINAHETGNIDIELNIPPGPGGAYLTVLSDDPTGPKHVSLRWHGKTQPFLNPRWIADTGVRLDQTYERTIHLVYPGGKSALVPRLEGYDCGDKSVQISAGSNNPLATKFATSGLLTKILGEVDLHLRVKPPSVPTTLQTVCALHLKYGRDEIKLNLPILLDFSAGQLTPSVTAITFSAANERDLLSQQRTVRITDQMGGSDIEVFNAPLWLSCKIERKTQKEFDFYFRLLKCPPTRLTQETLLIGRKELAKPTIVLRLNVLAPSS